MTTNHQPTVLITEVNGQDVMSADALALLWGIPADDITAYMQTHVIDELVDFPLEWLKAGKRRVKEASAAVGTNQLLDVLAYWAARDRDADIVLIDDAHGCGR